MLPVAARRVVVVVLDGLRPDAVDRFELTHVRRMMADGAAAAAATTVDPSITTAALTSLLTGVSPSAHGITADRFFLPRHNNGIAPLPQSLAAAGYPSTAFMADVPSLFRGLAARVGRRLGLDTLRLAGRGAAEILLAARSSLRTQRRGLLLFHWPDADHAGHRHGWMSDAYGDGCRKLDTALGALRAMLEGDGAGSANTLVVALADHGGGGATPNDHESLHPLDRTIPIMLWGASVAARELEPARLLDVPPTILWALGVPIPASYEGRVLHEAFVTAGEPASMAVA